MRKYRVPVAAVLMLIARAVLPVASMKITMQSRNRDSAARLCLRMSGIQPSWRCGRGGIRHATVRRTVNQ
jgi:hypothetical protein